MFCWWRWWGWWYIDQVLLMLLIRYYPSHPSHGNVILASYTWEVWQLRYIKYKYIQKANLFIGQLVKKSMTSIHPCHHLCISNALPFLCCIFREGVKNGRKDSLKRFFDTLPLCFAIFWYWLLMSRAPGLFWFRKLFINQFIPYHHEGRREPPDSSHWRRSDRTGFHDISILTEIAQDQCRFISSKCQWISRLFISRL